MAARGPRRLHVALGDQEDGRAGVRGRRELLLDAADRDHRAVEGDLPRPGDRPAARQVAGREQVVQAERPHQAGRGPADLPARDLTSNGKLLIIRTPTNGSGLSPHGSRTRSTVSGSPSTDRSNVSVDPDGGGLDRPARVAVAVDRLPVDRQDPVAGEQLAVRRAARDDALDQHAVAVVLRVALEGLAGPPPTRRACSSPSARSSARVRPGRPPRPGTAPNGRPRRGRGRARPGACRNRSAACSARRSSRSCPAIRTASCPRTGSAAGPRGPGPGRPRTTGDRR